MVKLVAVIIFDACGNPVEPKIVFSSFNLSSFGFFEQSTVQELCTFISRECAKKASKVSFELMTHLAYNVHIKSLNSGYVFTCVADDAYPVLAARSFLNKTDEIFQTINHDSYLNTNRDISLDVPELNELFLTCQDPTQVDKIVAIRAELDDTKKIIHETIDVISEQGESVDDLSGKSEKLNTNSNRSVIHTQSLNSCCHIL